MTAMRPQHLGLWVVLAVACSDSPPPVSAVPRNTVPAAPPAPARPATSPRAPKKLRIPGRHDKPAQTVRAPASPPAARVTPRPRAAGSQEQPLKRDLENELQAALTSLPTCITAIADKAAPKRIAIAIRATVTRLGRITRAELASAGLQPDELACAKNQVLGVRFRAPVENGPTAVTTRITLEQQRTK